MPRTQRTPYVILGLLGLSGRQARSGYEIKQAIDTVISHFWSESNGQIYPVLRRLSSQGLITEKAVKPTGRKKTMYAITAKGSAALRSWLKVAPEIGKPRDEMILKLFFGSQTEIPVLLAHLQTHRDRAEATLARCTPWSKAMQKDPFHQIMMRAAVVFNEANLKWAEESIATLNQMKAAKKP